MIKFSELNTTKRCGGLVPAIIQDDNTRQVLMLGYMTEEAYDKTVAEGRVTFFSARKNRLWTKGETSGNFLNVNKHRQRLRRRHAVDPRRTGRPGLSQGNETVSADAKTKDSSASCKA